MGARRTFLKNPSVRRRTGGGRPQRRRARGSAVMRMLLLVVLTAGLLALAQGFASASESPWPDGSEAPEVMVASTAAAEEAPGPMCDDFRHVQTYRHWGPARHFDRVVTVEYQASRCAAPTETAVDLHMEGTATIHEGDSVSGPVLGTRPFVVLGTWEHPANPMGWPPSWWQCGVSYAQYRWDIAGVYTFEVSATDGTWTLVVDVAGSAAGDLSWTYEACQP
jgi:hypothetical protein